MAAEPRRERRVAPQEQSLGSRPDPEHHVVGPILSEEVAVAVPGERTAALAHRHEPPLQRDRALSGLRRGAVRLPDRRLLVREPHVLGRVLRRERHRQTGRERHLQGGRVETLRVQVETHPAAGSHHAVEHRPPEVPAPLRDAALAVGPDRQPTDRRAGLQQGLERVAAVLGVTLWGEPLDRVSRIGALEPLVPVRPQPDLEVQPTGDSLLGGEPQHLQVALALLVRELRDPNTGAGHVHEERIREVEVPVGHVPGEVVPEPDHEVDAVEALRHHHRQVATPEALVVEPGLVVLLTGEEAGDASHRVGGPLDDRCVDPEGREGIRCQLDTVRELEHGIDEPSLVRTTREEEGSTVRTARDEAEGLGHRRDRHPGALEDHPRPCALDPGHEKHVTGEVV